MNPLRRRIQSAVMSGGPGPFTPARLPGLLLWLDASQISGKSDGDAISQWSDLSGNGNHWTQATGSEQPTYQTNEIGGKPVVQFDGVDDVLTRTALDFGSTYTVFVVFRRDASGESSLLFSSGGGYDFSLDTGLLNFANSSRDENAVSAALLPLMAPAVFSYKRQQLRKNGTAASLTGASFAGNNLRSYLGSNPVAWWPISIAEVVVSTSDLTLAQVEATESYLLAKWSPVLTLPNLLLWLDASQISGKSDGDSISQWDDMSGNGYHWTQATGSAQPTFQTNEINGQPVVRFDGVDDILTRAALDFGSTYTVFVVMRRQHNVGGPVLCLDGNAYDFYAVTARKVYFANSTQDDYSSSDWDSDGDVTLGVYNRTLGLRKNGASFGLTQNAFAGGNTRDQLGGRTGVAFPNNDLAEVIVSTSALTLAQVQTIENYLNAKYSIY